MIIKNVVGVVETVLKKYHMYEGNLVFVDSRDNDVWIMTSQMPECECGRINIYYQVQSLKNREILEVDDIKKYVYSALDNPYITVYLTSDLFSLCNILKERND